MRIALPLALGLCLLLTSLAGGDEAAPVSANIDYDPELERVALQPIEGQFSRRRVVIEDTCAGKPYTRVISSVQDTVDRLRIVNADGATQRPEIFFDARSGATGRGGDVRVVLQ